MIRDLNWNALFAFWVVARHGSFAEAARLLPRGSAQSLHKRVRDLERRQNLSLKLLRSRGMKGVELTEAGQRIYEFVDPFFQGMDGLIAGIQTDDSGSLSLGISPFGADVFGFRVLANFRRAFPKVTVNIRNSFSSDVLGMLLEGEVDIGICFAPEQSPGLVSSGRVPIESQFLVRSERLHQGEFRTWEEVMENPLVLPCRGSALRQNFDRLLAQRHLSSRLWIAAEVTSTQQVVEGVRAGLGVGLAPCLPQVLEGRRGIQRVRPPRGLSRLTMAVFHKEREHMPAYMRAFLDFASSVLTLRTLPNMTSIPLPQPLPNTRVQ